MNAAVNTTHPHPSVMREALADREFHSVGFVLRNLLTPDDLNRLKGIFARWSDRHEGAFSATLLIPDLDARRAIHHEIAPILQPAFDRVLNDYRAVFCGFAVKNPCDCGGEMPLHQDVTFSWPGPRPGISVWAPLLDVDANNGCLELIAGSQKLNATLRAPGSPAPTQEKSATRAALPVPMKAGEGLIVDHGVLHASPGNRSQFVRVAAAVILIPREEALLYCHRNSDQRDTSNRQHVVEVFEVPDDFLLSHFIGQRPDGIQPVSIMPEDADGITVEQIQTLLPH